tara:strand:- start:1115 stop:1246 length:132 start_codon:yes stop_codon:yes gene_type:complete
MLELMNPKVREAFMENIDLSELEGRFDWRKAKLQGEFNVRKAK